MATTDLSLTSWRKSTFSGGNSDCVEVAHTQAVVGIRDTKNPEAGHLVVPRSAWAAFVATIG